ncbi:hypothetical protein [Lactobacillus delbrueckii]|uniref:hypothetical protein n=1 Tax=Lactobacillus delbrueckii TaxID=1584 RepID=UPI001F41CCB6|nr:hypothetical protein [Lactobacillus delbrueckii]
MPKQTIDSRKSAAKAGISGLSSTLLFLILVHNRAAHGKVDQAHAGTENDDWPDSFSDVFCRMPLTTR